MTYEFRNLLLTSQLWQQKGIRSVLATVVDLNGSSYRRPGVRMLISELGQMEGALSGGCVEKEVLRQTESVFATDIPNVMTYDGRFRLGCEGVLYILLEPIVISECFFDILQEYLKRRKSFHSASYFKSEEIKNPMMGTVLHFDEKVFPLNPAFSIKKEQELQVFHQEFKPIFQLYIFGAEHDSVQLCEMASKIGWDVHIIAPPNDLKTIDYFKGAKSLSSPLLEHIDLSGIDKNTAVVLMSHSFSNDFQYFVTLKDKSPLYLGLLGPSKRRERLFSEFLNRYPDTDYEFFERIHGPTGLDIGAESASEIALSILAEILSVIRNAQLIPLKNKLGKIHD